MASPTNILKTRDRLKQKKAGRDRKRKLERQGTTPKKSAVFGDEKPAKA